MTQRLANGELELTSLADQYWSDLLEAYAESSAYSPKTGSDSENHKLRRDREQALVQIVADKYPDRFRSWQKHRFAWLEPRWKAKDLYDQFLVYPVYAHITENGHISRSQYEAYRSEVVKRSRQAALKYDSPHLEVSREAVDLETLLAMAAIVAKDEPLDTNEPGATKGPVPLTSEFLDMITGQLDDLRALAEGTLKKEEENRFNELMLELSGVPPYGRQLPLSRARWTVGAKTELQLAAGLTLGALSRSYARRKFGELLPLLEYHVNASLSNSR